MECDHCDCCTLWPWPSSSRSNIFLYAIVIKKNAQAADAPTDLPRLTRPPPWSYSWLICQCSVRINNLDELIQMQILRWLLFLEEFQMITWINYFNKNVFNVNPQILLLSCLRHYRLRIADAVSPMDVSIPANGVLSSETVSIYI